MTIEIKFKKIDDLEGEYYVSVDGRAGEFMGRGAFGRGKALGKIGHDKMSKEVQKKWLGTLEEAETKCEETFSVETDGSSLTLTVDDNESHKTQSIDHLAVVVSQIEAPKKGRRLPGF